VDERDFYRGAFPVALVDSELNRQPRATADGSSAVDEPSTVDVQTLPLVRQDESIVIRFVEPEHRSSHSWTPWLDARATGIGCQLRRWHIGQRGNSPLTRTP
jgi:hypothetical protein